MRLKPDEIALKGGPATDVGGRAVTDPLCTRIDWLTLHCLERVAHLPDEATTLFRDPADGRYWERSYPLRTQQEVGDGPPTLEYLTEEDARARYEF